MAENSLAASRSIVADIRTAGLEPGVVAQLRSGDKTRWVIAETLRKVYISR